MDPSDPFRPPGGDANNYSGRRASASSNDAPAHGVNSYHQQLSNPGYPMPGMPGQIPQYPSAPSAPPYAAAASTSHGMSYPYRPSPPNVPPQPYQQSPYFAPPSNGMINSTNVPVARYSPHTLPGYVAGIPQVRPSGNRVSLPPIRQNNAMAGSVSALGFMSNSTVGGANNNNANMASGVVARGAVGAGMVHESSGAQRNNLVTNNSIGKWNANSLPAFSSSQNQSAAAAPAATGFIAPAAAAGGTNPSKISHSLPFPETEPPSPLPPFRKSKEPMKSHHHPDMPFLVTHWVDHYVASASLAASGTTDQLIKEENDNATMNTETDGKDKAKKEALLRLQRAAKDMAWAFETLGAFGVSSKGTSAQSKPTTYTDLTRKFAPLLSSAFSSNLVAGDHNENTAKVALLDSLVSAGSSSTTEASKSVLEAVMPWSLLEAAYEGTVPTSNAGGSSEEATNGKSTAYGVGRRLGDPMNDPNDESLENLLPSSECAGSSITNPVLMGGATSTTSGNLLATGGKLAMTLGSNIETLTKHAAEASRKYLCARSEISEYASEFKEARRALCSAMTKADNGGATLASVAARRESDDQGNTNSDLDQHRVVAQQQRRIDELRLKINSVKKEASDAKKEAENAFNELSTAQSRYRDPYQVSGRGYFSGLRERNSSYHKIAKSAFRKNRNIVLPGIITQQYQGRRRPSDFAHTHMSVLKSRLSHVVTINCHLVYPVYCLKFDKTGKYFITGADDQLVKLFYLGAGPKQGERPDGRRLNYGANMRGAVLVCTLRGHAGVVTDVDVSSDNALLATASADGDVRIWGLKDGCPVAILRGHKDGANMVSWSSLTPYRLVTCGDDGLARMWDVREAALKRYGYMLGSRADYTLPDQKAIAEDSGCDNSSLELDQELPPVPMPQIARPADAAAGQEGNNVDQVLPEGGEGVGNGNPGEFVANGAIDEGVTLIARMQHGDLVRESQQQGVGTRARVKTVKVMCIARCPIGGHFATGSDDGFGRVWADSDDMRVENVDRKLSETIDKVSPTFTTVGPMFTRESLSARQRNILGSLTAVSNERLLATLSGHTSAITDLKYSSAGDRILTASMKDGVVRVWSWGKESAIVIDGHSNATVTSDFKNNASHAKFTNLTYLMIRLTPVNQGCNSNAASSSRRRGLPSAASSPTSVHCDGVTWTCDDMKIVTSQSSPKGNGSEILPGSHTIYVWDSSSGRCLLGILGSHTALCSTMVAHPFIPSVVVSAGSDGLANVWDLDKGKCIITHKNVLSHGPMENGMSRDKQCSYLEGQFSPDGSYLILSDESGRVTLFDTMTSFSNPVRFVPPSWMSEQYFANDYYELFYDSNGYCIERGSERPPHLAPKGVRCSHEGVGVAEDVRNTYVNLSGPRPLPPNFVRWSRSDIRNQSYSVRRDGGLLSRNVRKRSNIVGSPGVLMGCKTTAIVSANGKLLEDSSRDGHSAPITFEASSTTRTASSTTSGRPLSNRYTWVDFNDIAEEEDEYVDDSDDEEYRGEGRRLSRAGRAEDADVSSDDEILAVDADSPAARNRGRQRGRNQRRSTGQRSRQVQQPGVDPPEQAQPTRTSSRQNVRRTKFESEDEESVIEEFLSTHTKPSGEYVQDWEEAHHFFRMPKDSVVYRKWVTRTNNQESHYGMKIYCPQVGDSVVYIPRAHYDTLQRFPTGNYTAPWKSWPTSQPWPVVRCRVKHARYRFPYQMYHFNRRKNEGLKDVALILTLEITGVPIICGERRFPWPPPKFTSPIASRTRSHDSTFEVTMFDSGVEDFILPEFLYCWRIRQLEKAIERNGGSITDLSVTVTFPPDVGERGYGSEDPYYIPYEAKLIDIAEPPYEEEFHFAGSGYNALMINWKDSDGAEAIPLCAWDAQVIGSTAPKVPGMTAETKNAVNLALNMITKLDPKVVEWFEFMVDTRRYPDYLLMVEVPMYLSCIRQRLQNNYYTNKNSVVADMELIKENCYKYNEDKNEYYDLAIQMLDKFKSLVDAILNPPVDDSSESEGTIIHRGTNMGRGAGVSPANVELRSPSGPRTRRRLRGGRVLSHQSALANLPHPEEPARALRSTRSTGARNPEVNHQEESLAENEDEHDLSSQSDGEESDDERIPSRSTRASSRGSQQGILEHEDQIQPTVVGVRSSTRERPKTTYTEKDSDEDEFPKRTRTTNRRQRSTHVDNDEGSEEEVKPSRKSSRKSSQSKPSPSKASPVYNGVSVRTSSRTRGKSTYTEMGSDEEVESPRSTRASNRKRASAQPAGSALNRSARSRSASQEVSSCKKNPARPSDGQDSDSYNESEAEESGDQEEYHDAPSRHRRTSRRNANKKKSPDKFSDSYNESEAEESGGQEEYQDDPSRPSRTSRRKAKLKLRVRVGKQTSNYANKEKSPHKPESIDDGRSVRTSSRSKTAKSYTEKESDEEEYYESPPQGSDDDEASDEAVSSDEEVATPRKKRSRTQSESPYSDNNSPKKKRGRTSPGNKASRQKRGNTYYPSLAKWPKISKRMIAKVGLAVLNILRECDSEGWFSAPVAEVYPTLADDYLSVVSEPMDFRTIEELRLHQYNDISELQDDLILTFKNCCVFNGEGSDFYATTIQIWQGLNDAFKEACDEYHVVLPPRFS